MNGYTLNPFSIALLISAFISLLTAIYAWVRHPARGSKPLVIFLLGAAVWSGGYAFELASPTTQTKLFWAGIEYIEIAIAPTLLLFLVLQYTGKDIHFHPRHHILLAIEPMITLGLFWTNQNHGLIWKSWELVHGASFNALKISYGVGFWAHAIYSYTILFSAVIFLVQAYHRASSLYRSQTGVLLTAALIPWFANVLYIFQLSPISQLDLTPFAFTITGLIITWGLFHFKLFDIMPIAREVIIESLSDGVIVLDREMRIVDVNPAAAQLIGIPTDNIIGHPAKAVVESWPDLLRKFQHSQQAQISLPSGDSKRYFNASISPIFDRHSKLTGYAASLQDITEARLAQRKLRNLSRAVEQSASTILITNRDGRIEYVNPAFTQNTGYLKEDAIGKNPRILKSGRMAPETYKNMWQTLERGDVWQGEFINKKKNGDIYWETASISPVKNNQGEITHFVSVKDDISLRKEMEQELIIARDKAVEANRQKGQILANISHDMRSPLGAILGYTEMLVAGYFGALTENQIDKLHQISESTKHLTEFVNNLLAQAELEAGRLAFQSKPFSVEKLVQEVCSTAEILAQQKELDFASDVSPDLPDTLLGDLYWLRRILSNLIGNAIKFTDTGGVHLSIQRVDDEFWSIEVADTGQGIPLSEQAKIFEPFEQGSPKKHTSSGAGLGLAIVKDVTELMGGRVSLTSAINQGSALTVLLPLKEP